MQQYKETDCKTIKYEIAKLDREIIFRLVQRFRYQALAYKIQSKTNYSDSIKDFQVMLEQRQKWAISAGLSPIFVDKISQYLIDFFLTQHHNI